MRHQHAAKPFGKPQPKHAVAKGPLLSIRPLFLYGGFAALLATNALTLTGLLMAPDVSHVLSGQTKSVYGAYEDRIAQLRLEVDRLQSRHYAQAGDVNLQLQELQQTQEVLAEQQQYVKQLADKATALGIVSKPADPAPADAPAPAAPQTDDAALLTGSIAPSSNPSARLAATAASLNQMVDQSRLAMVALSTEATAKTDQIVTALAGIGIDPKLPDDDGPGEGGPLLPPVDGPDTPSLIDEANGAAAALDRLAAAKGAADLAPIHRPLRGVTHISSIYGNRKDPFTGRLAFHPGIDFAAAQGTTVLSAGAGIVSFVGQISGYGNAIEIQHANGVMTLYGHLSAFIVEQGDKVEAGTPIGRVGSTGRSTGPHLHFEVRRSDSTVNPAPYLNAGHVLDEILPS